MSSQEGAKSDQVRSLSTVQYMEGLGAECQDLDCVLKYLSMVDWDGSLPWTSVKSVTAMRTALSQCFLDCRDVQ
eukprot:4523732-Ditylum_brightwellii.AAC.1